MENGQTTWIGERYNMKSQVHAFPASWAPMKTLDGPLERYGKSISEIHKDLSDGHREGPSWWDLQKKVILGPNGYICVQTGRWGANYSTGARKKIKFQNKL